MQYLSPITLSEFVALLIAIALLIKDKSIFWLINIVFIAIALTCEISGQYLSSKGHYNLAIFNSFVVIENAFISYGMYHCLKKYVNPGPLIYSGLGISYATFLYFLYNGGFNSYNSLFAGTTVSVMSVAFVVYALYYYFKLLNNDEVLALKNHPEFWWVTGVLFYYFGSTSTNVFYGLFKFDIFKEIPLRLFIYYIINIILYSNWIYSYICRAKQRKLQS